MQSTGWGPKKRIPEISLMLANQRLKLKKTQAEIADELGYASPQFVSNWERGVSMPPSNKIREIAKSYKMKPVELAEAYAREHRSWLFETNKLVIR